MLTRLNHRSNTSSTPVHKITGNSSYMSSTNLGTHIKQTHKMNPKEVRAKLVKQKTWHEARGVNPA